MTIDTKTHRILINQETIYLTTTQANILDLLYKNKNNVIKYEEIVKQIYNTEIDRGLKNIIRKHISLLNKRIGRYIKIKNIRDVGYIIEEDLR